MASSYADLIDAIAAINSEIPGVEAAYDSKTLPDTLTVFPAAMTLLGPDDYGKFGPAEYWVRVYIAPTANSNPSIAYAKCLEMSQAFRDTYSQISRIGSTMVLRTHLTVKMGFGSTGFANAMKWGGATYYGFEVHLPLASAGPNA